MAASVERGTEDIIREREYIRSIVGTTAEAEDVFQEVFVRLAGMQSKAIRVEKPLHYVYVMARNEAFKAIKKRGEHRETPFEEGFLEAVAPRKGAEPTLTSEEVEKALISRTEEVITRRHHRRDGWIMEKETHHWEWVTTLPAARLSTRLLWQIGHARWEIEMICFIPWPPTGPSITAFGTNPPPS
jgi:hypothetical protein